MRIASVIAALAVPAVILGGVVVAEENSGRELTSELTEWVDQAIPRADITNINLRGRPYIVSHSRDEVSTAYVDLAVPDTDADVQLIVQNLNLNTDRAGQVRMFVTVPYPMPVKPVPTADGVLTPRAIIDGKKVEVRAELQGRKVTVTTTDGRFLGGATIPRMPGLKLDHRAVTTDEGVQVSLVAQGVRAKS
ncbi:MAG TPA: hypothetical protein PLO27_02540 [Marmoricola sp.]|nr:hypothetical protein [Marmoricola sp.]